MRDYTKLDSLEMELIRVLQKAYDIGFEDGRETQTNLIAQNVVEKVESIKFKEDEE